MVEQFAQQNPEIKIVGIGGLDSLALAEDFRSSTGANFQLLWDGEFDIWSHYGVSSQHTVLVFNAAGEPVDSFNRWDGDRVLASL